MADVAGGMDAYVGIVRTSATAPVANAAVVSGPPSQDGSNVGNMKQFPSAVGALDIHECLLEVMSCLPGKALAMVCMSSRAVLAASNAHWGSCLDEIHERHREWLFRRFSYSQPERPEPSLVGSPARIAYGLCAGGLRTALRVATEEAGCGPPTAEQISQFVSRLRCLHSWYKHLPIEEGVAFLLTMSPVGGLVPISDSSTSKAGQSAWCARGMPTAEYRRHFHFFDWEEVSGECVAPVTTTADMSRPLLVPTLSRSIIPVTACLYSNIQTYNVLGGVYEAYRRLRDEKGPASSSATIVDLTSVASRWTRQWTGRGLPREVLSDMAMLYDFERRHKPSEFHCSSAHAQELLRAAEELCSRLFPHYTLEAVRLEVGLLLFSSGRGEVANVVMRADGARAQTNMTIALVEWTAYVWGTEATPKVSFSLSDAEMEDIRCQLPAEWDEIQKLFDDGTTEASK